MSEIAISLRNISKCYKRYSRPVERLKELLWSGKSQAENFWALRDIDLDVPKGETLGIIGQNGSGKSTLLQIIAGTLTPTTGEVSVCSRVSALLELGSGFNPEFTGRQNVFFNGRILGLSQTEIEVKFDQIVAFADIGDFIDQPIKTYSSGMVVRLAFAVIANTDPQILIVDEALAVGDAKFQARCMKRIRQLKDEGVTILFVSHDSSSVQMLCNRAILLNHGSIIKTEHPKKVVEHYIALLSADSKENVVPVSEAIVFNPTIEQENITNSSNGNGFTKHNQPTSLHRHGNRLAIIQDVKLINFWNREVVTIETGEILKILVSLEAQAKLSDIVVGISIRNLMGLEMYGTNTKLMNCQVPELIVGQQLNLVFKAPCYLNKGIHTITVGIHSEDGVSYDWIDEVVVFEVINSNKCAGMVDLGCSVEIDKKVVHTHVAVPERVTVCQ